MEIRTVAFHRPAYQPEDFPRDQRPQIAIVGRSNVGKSTLINALLRRRDLARVSQTPGKTQAIHFYIVNERFFIVDLPGYGYAKVAKSMRAAWGDLMRFFFERSETLQHVFLLVDARRVPSDDDFQMRDWMNGAGVPWTVVMTKTDKLSKNELVTSRKVIAETLGVEGASLISFTKNNRQGVEDLWRLIDRTLQIQ